ncbi:hypothetical protein SADUNF_Sadunf15G0039200 [Salix dunnii]|uniref:HP domain-containing protein n=1 Tax=Salix dunnii TaxID=1413687 RepID=A0A835JFU7_9ROSI|nr:hypothetical protein SADUNF_Sadunf15G0039200 [Salix dunnii]
MMIYFLFLQVYLYGAHVISWKNDHAEELLFVSGKVHAVLSFIVFLENKPLIDKKSLESFTGFGSPWSCTELYCLDFDAMVPLRSMDFPGIEVASQMKSFLLSLGSLFGNIGSRVALGTGRDLMLTTRIRNIIADGKPLTFTFAYHTCFSVLDIRFILMYVQMLAPLVTDLQKFDSVQLHVDLPVEFREKFGMEKDVFYKLPKWKQNKLKMALDFYFDFEQSRAEQLILRGNSLWEKQVARDSSSKSKRFAVLQVKLTYVIDLLIASTVSASNPFFIQKIEVSIVISREAYSHYHYCHEATQQKPPLKKSGSYGKISPVLNVPPPYIYKGTANLFGLGSFLRN